MKNIKNLFIILLIGLIVISISSTKLVKAIEPEITVTSVYLPFPAPIEPEITSNIVAETLEKYNVKFPYIVLAQALHESGRFTSKVFIKNNNLFGLKEPSSRPTTALGTKNGHAYYETWEMSVLDYALYQAAFTRKIKKESNYLRYLNKNYAVDSIYDVKLKKYFKETKPKFK